MVRGSIFLRGRSGASWRRRVDRCRRVFCWPGSGWPRMPVRASSSSSSPMSASRRRASAPLARCQRRAQPWEARAPHTGPHRWHSRISTVIGTMLGVRVRLPRSRLSSSRPPRLGRPCGPSHAIGCGDPRHGGHSPGFGGYEDDGDEQSSSRRGPDTAQSHAGAPSRPLGSSLSGSV